MSSAPLSIIANGVKALQLANPQDKVAHAKIILASLLPPADVAIADEVIDLLVELQSLPEVRAAEQEIKQSKCCGLFGRSG